MLRSRRRVVLSLAAGLIAAAGIAIFVGRELFAPGMRAWLRAVSAESRALCRCLPDRDVEIRRADGVRLAGSLDLPRSRGEHPAVLLLHGNSAVGRKTGVYRILSRRLAERGFVVLSIDAAGHGESGDPFAVGTREALNPDLDARAALEYLAAREDVDAQAIRILCHSAGCKAGLSVGLSDPTVGGIVAIGPSRREPQRFEDEDNNEYWWERARQKRLKVFGTGFPEWYTKEVWMEDRRSRGTESYLAVLSRPSHTPVLLMDGGAESDANHAYLRDYFDRMAEPKAYVTVPRANHYSNTISRWGLVLYDRGVIERTVDEIATFLDSPDVSR